MSSGSQGSEGKDGGSGGGGGSGGSGGGGGSGGSGGGKGVDPRRRGTSGGNAALGRFLSGDDLLQLQAVMSDLLLNGILRELERRMFTLDNQVREKEEERGGKGGRRGREMR